jgi:hypothetical protein
MSIVRNERFRQSLDETQDLRGQKRVAVTVPIAHSVRKHRRGPVRHPE